MADQQEYSGELLGATLVTWMVDNRPGLDEKMKEEGSKALIQEFMAAEGGQGLPTPEERLDRARQASARAWLRHLAAAIQANWTVAPAGAGSSVTVKTMWAGAGGVRGVFERAFAPLGLRRIQGEVLANLKKEIEATGSAGTPPRP